MNKVLLFSLLLMAAAGFGAAPTAFADADRCERCLLATHVITHPETDTAVELELDTSAQVLALITTKTGKLRPLFEENHRKLPKEWVAWAQRTHPGVDPLDIGWDEFDTSSKLALIQAASKGRGGSSFFADRDIHGLTTRDTVTLNFTRPVTFLGQDYQPGTYKVDISKALMKKVEYMGPDSAEDASGVELHFRSNEDSGQLSNDAWTLLEGAGIPRDHQHVHIVDRLPVEQLKAEPVVVPAVLTDFFRRTNLAMEFVDIVEEQGRISPNRTATVIYFDSLKPDMVEGVNQYFNGVAAGNNYAIGDTYKMGWVGMRGSDKYDAPGLWGIEVRAISRSSDPVLEHNLLDSFQYTMHNDASGDAKDRIRGWLEKNGAHTGPEASQLEAAAWYNQSWPALTANAAPEVKAQLGGWFRRWKLGRKTREDVELKMLAFDWSKDPLVYDKPELLARIREQQVKALARVQAEPYAINQAMHDFIVDSGLYETVLSSLGVKIERAPASLGRATPAAEEAARPSTTEAMPGPAGKVR